MNIYQQLFYLSHLSEFKIRGDLSERIFFPEYCIEYIFQNIL
jgi:hypothetical protein